MLLDEVVEAGVREEGRPARVVVVGGGTAGWMTAAALARFLPRHATVRLIESEEIGIIGVGEATLPHIRGFLAQLGIAEDAFVPATQATPKLGIAFENWGAEGQRYRHPFSGFGRDVSGVGFHHFWLRAIREGASPAPLESFSIAATAARLRRFERPGEGRAAAIQPFGYAYHFDATRLAPLLRRVAERAGVVRTEGRVVDVRRESESGDIATVILESGEAVEGDLFVDCSGFRSLLLGDTMGEAWLDWTRWLPCDRAVALPCATPEPLIPETRATALAAGWQWRIPLQTRLGNGIVFSSAHQSEEQVTRALTARLEGVALADPRTIRFRAGRRTRHWIGNCVAIGLSAGFLEPLESTSIHLVQVAIQALVDHFPNGPGMAAGRDEFNRLMALEYDRARDFVILHYQASRRDEPFWRDARAAPMPDTLAEAVTLWRESGRLPHYAIGPFGTPSWLAVLFGQGVEPRQLDPRALGLPLPRLVDALERLQAEIEKAACRMPPCTQALRSERPGEAR